MATIYRAGCGCLIIPISVNHRAKAEDFQYYLVEYCANDSHESDTFGLGYGKGNILKENIDKMEPLDPGLERNIMDALNRLIHDGYRARELKRSLGGIDL